jgi:hypothetical protein
VRGFAPPRGLGYTRGSVPMRALLALAALCLLLPAAPARAEVIVLRDVGAEPGGGLTLSVPDDWARAPNAQPGDRITAVGPGGAARLTVARAPDARFDVYPRRYADAVQRVAVDEGFWRTLWAGRHDDVRVLTRRDGAGLGTAFAGWAEAAFTPTTGPDAGVPQRGIVAAGLYAGQMTTAACSAPAAQWPRWRETCLRALDSAEHRAVHTPFPPAGYYRNFMADGPVRINGLQPGDDRAY